MELHRRQEALGVLGVIGEDVRTELHLSAGLADALAHLERHDVCEFVGPFMQQRRGFSHDDGPIGVRLVPPGVEARLGRRELGLEFLVGQFLEFLQKLCRRRG